MADRVRQPVVVIAAIGTVLGGLAGYVTLYRAIANTPSAGVESAPPGKAASALSVLVFPLSNQTGDPARAYLAEGLTTALTADLSRISDAVVVPPLHAVALQKKELTLDRLGSEAGVRFVLQGAVAGSGDALRVTTQLMDTRSSRQLWSKTFETSAANLFQVQDELTERIRLSLGSEMVRHAAQDALQRQDKPQVADLLIRRRALHLQQVSAGTLSQGEELARRALAIDPGNPQAQSALAADLWIMATNFPPSTFGRDPARLGEEASRIAEVLLASDPDHWVALSVLATAARYRRDLESARRLYERAVAVDPRRWQSYNNLANAYFDGGEPERAREVLLKGVALPSYLPPATLFENLSRAEFMLNNAAASVEWARKAVDANPNAPVAHVRLAIAHALGGDEARAKAAGAELLRRFPDWAHDRSGERPWPGKEQQFEAFMSERYRPALRVAGLPVK